MAKEEAKVYSRKFIDKSPEEAVLASAVEEVIPKPQKTRRVCRVLTTRVNEARRPAVAQPQT
jgi:hypothetical protein